MYIQCNRPCKQIDGVAMGGTLSVTLMDWFKNKIEKDVVILVKPKFYCRYVDEIYNRRNEIQSDKLLKEYKQNVIIGELHRINKKLQ